MNFKKDGTTDFDYISVLGNYVIYIRFSMVITHACILHASSSSEENQQMFLFLFLENPFITAHAFTWNNSLVPTVMNNDPSVSIPYRFLQ